MCDFRSSLLSKKYAEVTCSFSRYDDCSSNCQARCCKCYCLVVTQLHSVLSAFSLSLLDCIHPHRSSNARRKFYSKVSSPLQACSRNKPAYRPHSSDFTDHDAVWWHWCLWCTGRIMKVLTPILGEYHSWASHRRFRPVDNCSLSTTYNIRLHSFERGTAHTKWDFESLQ